MNLSKSMVRNSREALAWSKANSTPILGVGFHQYANSILIWAHTGKDACVPNPIHGLADGKINCAGVIGKIPRRGRSEGQWHTVTRQVIRGVALELQLACPPFNDGAVMSHVPGGAKEGTAEALPVPPPAQGPTLGDEDREAVAKYAKPYLTYGLPDSELHEWLRLCSRIAGKDGQLVLVAARHIDAARAEIWKRKV